MPKSALNGLLLKLEDLYNEPPTGSRAAEMHRALAVAEELNALFSDPDYEVNRDLFDGVSNPIRRIVVLGFIRKLLEELTVSLAAELITDVLLPGATPPSPAASQDDKFNYRN